MSCQRASRAVLLGPCAAVSLMLTVVAPVRVGAAPSAPAGTTTNAGGCGAVPKLDRAAFPALPAVDNTFLPLIPGTRMVLDGFVVEDDGLRHPHRVEATVTDVTKVIDGVRSLIVYEQDFEDGDLQESELAFEAQDGSGNVWNMGEYPEEYEDGALAGAPSTWLSGVEDAHAGYNMLARPRLGTATYLQGLSPNIAFKDCATVYATDQHVCADHTCYDGVLVTDEYDARDVSGGHQRKYYAPQVGVIKVTAASGIDPETLELVKSSTLCRHALDQVRADVLAQDARGYEVAPRVYGATDRAERTLVAPGC